MRGSPEDAPEIFQDAVAKLIARGLEQFRGVSEQKAGQAASPRTFFLRIVKHAAIDRYRRSRDERRREQPDAAVRPSAAEAAEIDRAVAQARHAEERAIASETYWAAFARLQREHPNEAIAWDLYHHQDLEDHQACAQRLGISLANSYKRVSRAQAHLRLYLLEMREEDDR